MSGDRLDVSVTFDERRGYVASAPDLRQPGYQPSRNDRSLTTRQL